MSDPARNLTLIQGGADHGPEDDVQLSLMDHLQELRKRLIYSIWALVACFVVTFTFSARILTWVMTPVWDVLGRDGKVVMLHPTEGFFVYMRIAAYAAVAVGSPFILYQLYKFVAPGLYRRERRLIIPFVGIGTAFFSGGVLFARYLILPFALKVLVTNYTGTGKAGDSNAPAQVSTQWIAAILHRLNQATDWFSSIVAGAAGKDGHVITPMLGLEQATDFVLMVLLAFGIIFQLPLILSLLARFGIVSSAFLAKYRRYAIVGNTFIAAIITPTGDAVNLALMAVPLMVFYELGIVGARLMERKAETGADAVEH